MNPVQTLTRPIFIVGAGGLLAGELARLLESHPGLQLEQVASREGGRALRELHPHLTRDLRTVDFEALLVSLRVALEGHDGRQPCAGLFLALPHGESAECWQKLSRALGPAAAKLAVVDLSADFRLRDAGLYEAAYARPHPDPEGREGFVYGLPELYRSRIVESRRVAAPGCFATAMQLALLPAACAWILDASQPWIMNGVTGSSGSGVAPKPGTHHPFRHASYTAYAPGGHRHEAELAEALREHSLDPPLHFVPHSGPWSRGIHMTCSLPLARPVTQDQVQRIYSEHYAVEPFVEVLPVGSLPALRAVVGSNRASLGLHVRDSILTVLLALDNTLKGGAGQALQCMNLLLDEPETQGLPLAGLGY